MDAIDKSKCNPSYFNFSSTGTISAVDYGKIITHP
jgi:hypothetical protein